MELIDDFGMVLVSTHSRLKAAGLSCSPPTSVFLVSTHSRLKAAGQKLLREIQVKKVSTHSRLKAAGCLYNCHMQ